MLNAIHGSEDNGMTYGIFRSARETGNEQSVQVRYDEGVAIHIDHEPCAVACEGDSEASAEEHIGQPLSPAKIHIPGADAVAKAEGNPYGHGNASARTARRGRRTWHVQKLVTREPRDRDPTPDQWQQRALVRIGKARSRSR